MSETPSVTVPPSGKPTSPFSAPNGRVLEVVGVLVVIMVTVVVLVVVDMVVVVVVMVVMWWC